MSHILKMYAQLVLAALLVAAPALVEAADAEDSEKSERIEETERTVGLGAKVAVNGTKALPGGGLGYLTGAQRLVGTPSIIFSLPVSESIRVEPQVTLDVFDEERTEASEGDEEQVPTLDNGWMFDVGAAVHKTWRPFDRTVGYAGVTVGYVQSNVQAKEVASDGEPQEGESSTRSFYGGPVVGAEYLIGEAFSVGAEASVELRHSETETDGDVSPLLSGNGSRMNLNTEAFLVARMYLW
ncbi:MAG: hypothetical protein ACOCV2_01935 [Persicimonas sp.]